MRGTKGTHKDKDLKFLYILEILVACRFTDEDRI